MTTTYREERRVVIDRYPIKTVCDRCGKAIRNESYSKAEFALKYESGTAYPEGGSGDGWKVNDLCADCAEYLRELLVSSGFTVEDYTWEF